MVENQMELYMLMTQEIQHQVPLVMLAHQFLLEEVGLY
jgi:hypothetical protein